MMIKNYLTSKQNHVLMKLFSKEARFYLFEDDLGKFVPIWIKLKNAFLNISL